MLLLAFKEQHPGSMSHLWAIKFKTQKAKFIPGGDKTNESFFFPSIISKKKCTLIVKTVENT